MSKTDDTRPEPPKSSQDARAERLKAALKANIAKRKVQARARTTKDEPPENEQA